MTNVLNLQNTNAPRPSRTQEERNALAKEALGKAALELFALKGYDATSLADIGHRAGYSRSLVKYHFGSKSGLAESLLEDAGQRDLQNYLLVLPEGASGDQAWRCLLDHLEDRFNDYCRMYDDHEANLASRGEMILNATAIFTQDESLANKLRQISNRLIKRVTVVMEICKKEGVLRNNVDCRRAAIFYVFNVWSMANALFAAPSHRSNVVGIKESLEEYLNNLRQLS